MKFPMAPMFMVVSSALSASLVVYAPIAQAAGFTHSRHSMRTAAVNVVAASGSDARTSNATTPKDPGNMTPQQPGNTTPRQPGNYAPSPGTGGQDHWDRNDTDDRYGDRN